MHSHPAPTALAGMRVLECSEGTAGAFCSKLLSDLGAEVISLAPAKRRQDLPPGRETYLSTGKRLIDLDWEQSEGRDRLAALCREADVLIDDLGRSRSAAIVQPHASLIWCAISPFGATGPYADFKARHLNTFHGGGEGHLLPSGEGFVRFPERPPVQIGGDAGDFDTGANAAIAVLAAYRSRLRSGRGVKIDVSAQESLLTLNRTRLSRFNHDGVEMRRTPHPYVLGGMFACRDGWVQIVGSRDDYWLALARQPGAEVFADPRFASAASRAQSEAHLRRIVAAWCAERTKQEVLDLLSPAGFPVGAFATAEEVAGSAQLAYRGFFQTIEVPVRGALTLPGVPYQFSATPVRLRPPSRSADADFAPRPQPPSPGEATAPLAGVRILDFTWAAAGPYTTMLLGLLGAEVIKVESLRRPDPARRGFLADYGGIDHSPNFNELNLNKRSLQVDLTDPAGLKLIHALLPLCDVVVDNFRPGVMSRFGLDAATLLKRHPEMIVGSSSGNGSTGPAALTAGLASIFSAAGGLSEQTGYPDGPPTEVGESTDYRSGNAFALAILAALIHRDRTGQGQSIDLSSTEAVAAIAPDALLAYFTGANVPPRRGNAHYGHAPHGLYATAGADEWVSVAVTSEDEWRGLCRLLGCPETADAYPTPQSRKADEAKLDALVGDWARGRTAREAFLALQAHGVPSAPCFTNRMLAEEPHLAARGVFVDVEHPVIGRHRVMGPPWRFSEPGACGVRRHGPLMGEDNDYVLSELLGLSEDERAQLSTALR